MAKQTVNTDARAVRLAPVLERHREVLASDLSEEFVQEIADIEEQFQFNDDREEAKRRIRQALSIEVQQRLLGDVAE